MIISLTVYVNGTCFETCWYSVTWRGSETVIISLTVYVNGTCFETWAYSVTVRASVVVTASLAVYVYFSWRVS